MGRNNKKLNQKAKNNKWEPIKMEGQVTTHDNADFEGFSSLEVLENYDRRLVKKTKIQKDDLNLRTVDSLVLRKTKEKDSGLDSDENILSEFDDEEDFGYRDSDEEKPSKKRRKKNSDKPAKSGKKLKTDNEPKKVNKENAPGRFVLLKPPKDSDEESIDSGTDDTKINQTLYKNWKELGVSSAEILKALNDKGFTNPTEIQTLALPPAIFGKRDILGAAETGSGKTLAFGIPIIEGIIRQKAKLTDDSKPLYAVILTPTRELASQIHDHFKDITKYTDIKVAAIFGGMAVPKQKRVLNQHPEIVIATPGRLWELFEEGDEHLAKLGEIKYFVVDETDRMVEKGHFEEMHKLLEVINAEDVHKKNRRNFIFSATLTMVHDLPDYVLKRARNSSKPLKQTPGQKIQQLIEAFGLTDPKVVDITSDTRTAKNLTESRILCQTDQKDIYLYYFLQKHPGRTIIFCNSIECVKRLVSLLSYLNCNPYSLHGNMIQKQRLKNIDRFKNNPLGLLVATDVAARGLDIPLVQHVIHYQVPRTTENYVHRSGRTARANNEGLAVLIMDPSEVKYYTKLYQDLGRTEDLPLYPTVSKFVSIARERVVLAREVEKIDLKLRRNANEDNWLETAAKEAELGSDSSDQDSDEEDFKKRDRNRTKSTLREKSLRLAQLLANPMFVNTTKYPTGVLPGTKQKATDNESAVSVIKQSVADHKEWKNNRKRKNKH
uniref:ATP-dependent RNA helicase n=1 Tax=Culicoides sonorensis TaxID=179676 RepID=A0A336M2Q6_CULSO